MGLVSCSWIFNTVSGGAGDLTGKLLMTGWQLYFLSHASQLKREHHNIYKGFTVSAIAQIKKALKFHILSGSTAVKVFAVFLYFTQF